MTIFPTSPCPCLRHPGLTAQRAIAYCTVALIAIFLYGCSGKQIVYPPPIVQPSAPATQPAPAKTKPPPSKETTKPAETVPPSVPEQPAPSPSPAYVPRLGPAAGLYHQAEKEEQNGQHSKAEMLIQRALGIEARNPHYYYTLAQIKYQQKQYPETIQFCLKSKSLARGLPQLIKLNDNLIEQAKKAK